MKVLIGLAFLAIASVISKSVLTVSKSEELNANTV